MDYMTYIQEVSTPWFSQLLILEIIRRFFGILFPIDKSVDSRVVQSSVDQDCLWLTTALHCTTTLPLPR